MTAGRRATAEQETLIRSLHEKGMTAFIEKGSRPAAMVLRTESAIDHPHRTLMKASRAIKTATG
jgi:hypothetical protein